MTRLREIRFGETISDGETGLHGEMALDAHDGAHDLLFRSSIRLLSVQKHHSGFGSELTAETVEHVRLFPGKVGRMACHAPPCAEQLRRKEYVDLGDGQSAEGGR